MPGLAPRPCNSALPPELHLLVRGGEGLASIEEISLKTPNKEKGERERQNQEAGRDGPMQAQCLCNPLADP